MQLLYNRQSSENFRKNLRQNQTDAERKFWNLIRGRRLSNLKFRRQFSVGPYTLDFYCPAIRLAIELDGGQHAKATNYDQTRTEYLNKANIKVARFWNNDVLKNSEGVYDELLRIIETDHHLTLPSP